VSKLFIFMPRLRTLGKTHVALWDARKKWGKPHMYVEYQHQQPHADGYDNVTMNYELARQHFLQTDCDAFVAVEDDVVIPDNALGDLAEIDADVSMGVYCLRQKPSHRWNTFYRVADGEGLSWTEKDAWQCMKWVQNKDVAEVEGVGLGITLIHRHVLEKIKFERRGNACNDWYFSIDCQTHGFTQKAHYGVLCGHIMVTGTRRILWPDITQPHLHRSELL